VAQLEGAPAADDWLVLCRETPSIQVEATKPVIVDIHIRTDRTESPLRNEDVVSGAERGARASVITNGSTKGDGVTIASPHVIGDNRVLYAAVALLLSYTVLIVLAG